jgi:hypothetical protein
MTDQTYWEIKPDSTSYRFLKRWTTDYHHHYNSLNDPQARKVWESKIAQDFCTYYRHVCLWVIIVFLMGYLAIVCPFIALFEQYIFSKSPLISFIEMCSFCIGALEWFFIIAIPVAWGIRWIGNNVITKVIFAILDFMIECFPKKKNNKQSFIKTLIESKRYKFCKLIKYT